MQRLVQLTLLVSLTALVGVGCGGEGFTQGGGGAGSGGTSAGMSAGGSAGTGSGGIAGIGIGGVSTGGGVSGGSASGGSPDGGRGGAPPTTCTTDQDCMNCAYPTAPASKQQCY